MENVNELSNVLEQRIFDQIAEFHQSRKHFGRVGASLLLIFDPLAQDWQT